MQSLHHVVMHFITYCTLRLLENWQRFYAGCAACMVFRIIVAWKHFDFSISPISTYNRTLHILRHMQVDDNHRLLLFLKYTWWWVCMWHKAWYHCTLWFALIPVLLYLLSIFDISSSDAHSFSPIFIAIENYSNLGTR